MRSLGGRCDVAAFPFRHHVWHTLRYNFRHGLEARVTAEKIRENKLRRMAERQGLRLEKSRRRDERAYDYGTYQLVDPYTNTLVASGHQHGYGLSLDEIEQALTT
jgi:hypothetical protein